MTVEGGEYYYYTIIEIHSCLNLDSDHNPTPRTGFVSKTMNVSFREIIYLSDNKYCNLL